ncbi:MAG TPA: UDP-glucose/GDP-mannose dehydrogenase family protein [Blastocatellia bacterium]|nr:UDP-glucose/GDP-mannose dehydrogenase family protein [Blastocatellia bacterium]
MKISILGLGYVGCVSAACFAEAGHEVIGVDVNEVKTEIINSGRSPIVEPGVGELIAKAVGEKRLRATTDTVTAVNESDLSLVCVGTPGQPNGSLDLTYVKRICQQIGEALARKQRYHVVAIRSTMLPGTIHETVIPTLEVYSGRRAGKDFGVAINPEFLREGTALADFHKPPFTLIGTDHEEAANLLRRLYATVDAPVITAAVREAEMMKYVSNCYHALKVTFANEIGALCRQLGVDSHRVMEIFCQDTKLNISSAYLKPGFAFGGSCLPKDLRAIVYQAKALDLEVPVLASVMASNQQQIQRAVEMVLKSGKKQIGVLGLSFKAGTDDLRESPMVTLIETLIGKGLKLLIYDREVELARLFGANKDYIEREIPHISSLMHSSLDEVIAGSEVIIIGKKDDEYRAALESHAESRLIIDLVRMPEVERVARNYRGIGW